MKKTEIESKFDEIVEFAGVDQFIDTPVKRYSSGMYLRLAFSVAAHLVSEILFVDEVLAVGDAAFQKKCVGQNERGCQGRPHGLVREPQPCSRSYSLYQRHLAGARASCRQRRHRTRTVPLHRSQTQVPQDTSATQTRFTSILVNGENPGIVESGDSFEVSCTLQLADAYPRVRLFCVIQDTDGEELVVAPCSKELLAEINHPGPAPSPNLHSCFVVEARGLQYLFQIPGSSAGMGSARFLSDTIMLDVAAATIPRC